MNQDVLARRERADAVARFAEIRAELSDDFEVNRHFIEQTYYAFQDDSLDHCAVEHLVARYFARRDVDVARHGVRIHGGNSETVRSLAGAIIAERFDQFDRASEE